MDQFWLRDFDIIAAYRQILEKHGYAPVSLESYWQMKREGVNVRQQLATIGAQAISQDFLLSWLEDIEQPDLLALDCLQPNVTKKLQEWYDQDVQLVLATLRRDPECLYDQLVRLKLNAFFKHVVVCGPSRGGIGKAEQVKGSATDLFPDHCLWIGDTEVDIKAAGLSILELEGVFFKPLSNKQIQDNWSENMIQGFYELGKDFPDLSAELFAVCCNLK